LPWVRGTEIRETIVGIFHLISTRMHDVHHEPVRIFDGGSGVIHEPCLAYLPLLDESGAIGSTEWMMLQISNACLTLGQLGLSASAIAFKFGDPALVFWPEMFL
jgi:hypothetical protein